jgi:ABC-type microcin C transport system duplicated ATPase subunit YejF
MAAARAAPAFAAGSCCACRRELNRIRGVRLAMIFQDPMTSLNPYLHLAVVYTKALISAGAAA